VLVGDCFIAANDDRICIGPAVAKGLWLWHFWGMKAFWFATSILVLFIGIGRAQSQADDKYLGIYNLIQRADQLAETGEPGEALATFGDAQSQLLQFQRVFPTWYPNIVSFRLNHITDRIAELKSSKTFAKPADTASATPIVAPPIKPVTQPAAAQSTQETDGLRAELQVMREANQLLQAKLKEALTAQPAAVDARELARAQEKIRWLMKQNDLLTVSRQNVLPTTPQTTYMTNIVKVFVTNSGPVVVTNLADAFKKSPDVMVVTNFIRTVVVDTNAIEMLKLERAAAVKNLNEEHKRAEELADQLKQLQQIPRRTTTTNVASSSEELAALQAENVTLKGELQRVSGIKPAATSAPDYTAELKQAQAQIATLKSENEILALEKMALQGRLQRLSTTTNSNTSAAAYEARIRELMLERNDLIERMDLVSKQKPGKNTEAMAQLGALNREVTVLRSRLAAAEAQPVPYTTEELAFFKKATPAPTPASPDAGKKSIKQMPAGTAELVTSAQRHFIRQEYDKAEADYLKILERDQNNAIALANLAMTELQLGKDADAENHLKAALTQSPDDGYALSTMGYLRFRQEKYEDALNYLSRAAQISPSNPEVQNHLGATLNHLGQRKPAEAALRRAVQIAPNYGPAHNNLAVMYLSQQPPLPELARWHYQRAIESGQARNPDLEKALAEKGAPVQ
jgi:tetratricopeptide (TPR) repeat protein